MTEDNIQKLFQEFPAISTEEWESLIKNDLKGADYNKKLVWQAMEGFEVRPYYRAGDLEDLKYLTFFRNDFPFSHGSKITDNSWIIRQDIEVNNIGEANAKALNFISGGCNSICFEINSGRFRSKNRIFSDQAEFTGLLRGIDLQNTRVNFITGHDTLAFLYLLNDERKLQKINKNNIKSHFDFDPAGSLTESGYFKYGKNKDKALEVLYNYLSFVRKSIPSAKLIGIHGDVFSNSGADAASEIAFSLAIANDYFAYLTGRGLGIDDITTYLWFNLGISSNYFIEIAKIRALRYLYANVVKAYNPVSSDSCGTFIHSVTSGWNKTIYDPYVNILRCTTEAMSAITGGADSLSVRPFDSAFSFPNEFSERIAKNIQLILKEEACFDKVIDPAGGSYYVEKLTDLMVVKAWELFNKIEKEGGYIEAFCNGVIQRDIKNIKAKHDLNFAVKKEILVGTNQYPDAKERMKDKISKLHVIEEGVHHHIAEPVKQYRAAEEIEKLRLSLENLFDIAPRVFLLTFGNPAMRKARAAFSANFFGCAGFEIIDNTGFNNIEEGINAAINSNPDIVVICSSDEDYAENAPAVINHLKDKTILVLSGYPENLVNKFIELGLKQFIHLRSDIISTLYDFRRLLLEKRDKKLNK